MSLPIDSSVQAEYDDGFILDETTNQDVSLYNPGHNTFYDILNGLPEANHGKLARFSVFWKDKRYDIDWRELPENARPIRFRHGFMHTFGDGSVERGFSGVDFGYQYTFNGENKQSVEELR